LNEGRTFLAGSQLYEPVALLRRDGESLIVARVGSKSSKRLMILTPEGAPAWPHEPLGSLSDAAWSLRAHEWHLIAPEPLGPSPHAARRLARLLRERVQSYG
jgi:hypothetical protein